MATREQPRDFGRYLQACRISQGISLEAVSRMTRITRAILKQIESEDMAKLPAPVFVKGFLRAYAEEVGADKDEVLARFEASLQSARKLKPVQASREKPRSYLPRVLLALILVVIVIGGTLYISGHYLTENGETPTAPQVSQPAPEAETPSSRPADAGEPPAEVAAPEVKTETAPQVEDYAAPAEGNALPETTSLPEETAVSVPEKTPAAPEEKERLELKLVAVEPTWLKIITDDQVPQEYSMGAGDTLRLEAHDRFNLLIGNATGVRLTFNGKPVAVPGKSGQVVTLQLP